MNSRERILDGAALVMHERGIGGATTREIAKASGVSEAMLYKLFPDKTALFVSVLIERLPPIAVLTAGAEALPAMNPVVDNIQRLIREVLAFYLQSFPIAVSVFSDPELLRRHREAVADLGLGPNAISCSIAQYLNLEQRRGRIGSQVAIDAAAETLVGACLHRAFLTTFAGAGLSSSEVEQFAQATTQVLKPALDLPAAGD